MIEQIKVVAKYQFYELSEKNTRHLFLQHLLKFLEGVKTIPMILETNWCPNSPTPADISGETSFVPKAQWWGSGK